VRVRVRVRVRARARVRVRVRVRVRAPEPEPEPEPARGKEREPALALAPETASVREWVASGRCWAGSRRNPRRSRPMPRTKPAHFVAGVGARRTAGLIHPRRVPRVRGRLNSTGRPDSANCARSFASTATLDSV